MVNSNFGITSHLVGREDIRNKLVSTLIENDLSSNQFVLINGPSGVGKTTLVEHVILDLKAQGIFTLREKFADHLGLSASQGIPNALKDYLYDTLVIQNNEKSLERLNATLGENLSVFFQLFPSIATTLKQSTDVQSLEAHESIYRFVQVISLLIRSVQIDHPKLLFFLDDLHWAGRDSLDLLANILKNNEIHNIVVIGAYRPEQVKDTHPLLSVKKELAESEVELLEITLEALDKNAVDKILLEQFGVKPESVNMFSEKLYTVSRGNPLMLQELVSELQNDLSSIDELVQRIEDNRQTLAHTNNLSENVIELITRRFSNLPENCQDLMRVASCIGSEFSLLELNITTNMNRDTIKNMLDYASSKGLISPGKKPSDVDTYRFSHDRIMDSVYRTIAAPSKIHCDIGRAFLQDAKSESPHFAVDDAVFQLNQGLEFLFEKNERLDLCRLNVSLGNTAIKIGAFHTALSHFEVAKILLPANYWQVEQKMGFSVYLGLTESNYLTGNFDKAESLSSTLMEQAVTDKEKLRVYILRVIQLTNQSNWEKAIDVGMEGLKLYDIDIENPRDFTSLDNTLNTMNLEEIINLPLANDELSALTMALLIHLVSPFYVLRPQYLGNLVKYLLSLTFDKGQTKESAYAYVMYGIILAHAMGKYKEAKTFSQLGIQLNTRLSDTTLRCKVKLSSGTNLYPWVFPIKEGIQLVDSGVIDGKNSGDIITTGYCHISYLLQVFESGMNIDQFEKELKDRTLYLKQTKNPVIALTYILQQTIHNLRGSTTHVNSLSGSDFDEDSFLSELEKNQFHHGLHLFYVTKMLLCIINNQFEQALDFVDKSASSIPGALGQFSTADHVFYHSLILCELYRRNDGDSEDILQLLKANQEKMHIWLTNCHANFLHKYLLIQAEILALNSNHIDARSIFTDAAREAERNGFIQDAAISLERHAYFEERRGDNDFSGKLLDASKRMYARWGAKRKAS